MAQRLSFHGPKVYDPNLAEQRRAVTVIREPKSLAQDLGFEDDATSPKRSNELTKELEDLRAQVADLRASLEEARTNETRCTQKLQSFQQVNRSQSALMRGELQKLRRRQAHTEAVAKRLRDQAAFFAEKNPGVQIPAHLQGMPTEEKASEEAKELLQMHRRWENDLVQLQTELLEGNAPIGGAGSEELESVRRQMAEAQDNAERYRRHAEDLAKELSQVKLQNAAAPLAGSPTPPPAIADSTGNDAECATLRKALEAAEDKQKDGTKKLKQLATAYKKLEQEKHDYVARLQVLEAEVNKVREPTRKQLAPELLDKVKSAMDSSRAELAQLKAAVATDMQKQFPLLLEQAVKSQMPNLQKAIDAGSKEWREKYTQECERRRKLHNLVQELKGNIRVYCRVRPLSADEAGSCISFPAPDEIRIENSTNGTKKTWQFNEVLRENSTQADLFAGIRDLVVSMIDGYNVCIFAYGQTGSGKTHSMQGPKENPGVYMRTFHELFKVAKERSGWTIDLKVALIEVYNEEIRDLLADSSKKKEKLMVKQGKEGNHVPNLTLSPVNSPEDVDNLLSQGQAARTVAATDMNAHSSRSHLLVQIHGSMTNPDGKNFSSVITLVDLAGSERLAKSGVSGDRAKEAIAINQSLTALGSVINARATKSSHIPYRDSKLTHLLQDSLGGDSKTLMLLQINPCSAHVEESLCSLQFGARVNAVEMKK